jgi:UDP:flavonoid glycosyltransferase YjiC (YdhE family)
MPMLGIGQALRARGHDVAVLTGRSFRRQIEAAGLRFLPLPIEADYDDAHLDDWLPGRAGRRGLDAGRHDVIGLFVDPLVAQHDALTAARRVDHYDGIVCETGFLGAMPMLLTDRPDERPPTVGVSLTPIAVRSVDCAPFGSALQPGNSPHTRRRNRFLNTVLTRGPLKPIQTAIDESLARLGIRQRTCNYFDYLTLFDTTFHFGARGFEYPRRELPSTVHFVGPIDRARRRPSVAPDWWGDLDGERPVVHVTQGTLANADPTRLLIPAIRALAGEDVLVVASTGGRDPGLVRTAFSNGLPANTRVVDFVPYDDLLPRTDVMVTNGGYGGVQQALAHGVPLVVAGSTEDKPEVGARVTWSGTGINLRTSRPSDARIRTAVRSVISRPRYRLAAGRLRAELASIGDPVGVVVAHLEAQVVESLETTA